MKSPALDEDALRTATTDEIHSALFDQLVTGHAQMALMFLGKIPHPETGSLCAPALEEAKIFIDQLEMLESRTRGNLNPGEVRTLRQALALTRQAFAEEVDRRVGDPPGPDSPSPAPAG